MADPAATLEAAKVAAAQQTQEAQIKAEAALKAQAAEQQARAAQEEQARTQAALKLQADQKAAEEAKAAQKVAEEKARTEREASEKARLEKEAAEKKAKEDATAPWDRGANEADNAAGKAALTELALKAPEGSKMEAAQLERFAAEAKAIGLNPEQAQKLLNRDYASQKAQDQAISAEMASRSKVWLGELQTKWGDKFAENAEHVKRGLADFDPTGKIHQLLKAAQLTTHPDIAEALANHGRKLAEDKLGAPPAGRTNPNQNLTPEEKMAADYRRSMAPSRVVTKR